DAKERHDADHLECCTLAARNGARVLDGNPAWLCVDGWRRRRHALRRAVRHFAARRADRPDLIWANCSPAQAARRPASAEREPARSVGPTPTQIAASADIACVSR